MSEPNKNKPESSPRDVPVKPFLWFFAAGGLAVFFVFTILRMVLADLESRDFDRAQSLPAFVTERQLPPENLPRLQVRPAVELTVQRAYEQSLINNGIAWADPGKTKVRIPVTNAMEILVAKQAFPARSK
jgi:hypothetical protein